jgi:predicted ATPase
MRKRVNLERLTRFLFTDFPMSAFIEHIEIKNFKSIRHLEMDGFKKINLFIGKPNVGKSNILEALSVFTIPYLRHNSSKKLTDLIRLEDSIQIFQLEHNRLLFSIGDLASYQNVLDSADFLFDNLTLKPISNGDYLGNVKRYSFHVDSKLGRRSRLSFLKPPFGNNLLYTLELLPQLREVFSYWFSQYDLRLVLDKASHSLKIMKDTGKDVFILPYSSIADTLQRIIFYKTAIASNQNSVLIFEEPEAHAYPPYIAEFTQEVTNSETNQFFMATHSPIVVNDFLENAIDDLAIFMVDFKDGQTKVKGLSIEEIKDVYKYGIDLFFNGESYPVL